jgi:tRNA A37 N6-isopentenylltransferase MiaA
MEEALASTVRATCRYAKRQLTWFRREEGVTWFSVENPDVGLREVCDYLEQQGLGGDNAED